MPRLPVATPLTRPCSSYSTSAAAKPGKISTPSASACCASHFTTSPSADDVVAVVVEAVAAPASRACASTPVSLRNRHVVGGHRLVAAARRVLPVGDQLGDRARVHHRARQDVRAGLGAFLEHHHRHLVLAFGGELLQADRGGQARRPAADDHDVVLHRLARAVLLRGSLVVSSMLLRCGTGPRARRFYESAPAPSMQRARAIVCADKRCVVGAGRGAVSELQHRSVGPRRPGHRRVQRPGRAVRAHVAQGRRRCGAGGAPRRAAEGAARRDRGRRRRRPRGGARRDRPRQHPRRGGARRDRDGRDRHPRQQRRRRHHAEAHRRDARGLRLRHEHQRARRVLRRAGGGQAHDRARQGHGAGHLHRRAHRQHRVDGRLARRQPASACIA